MVRSISTRLFSITSGPSRINDAARNGIIGISALQTTRDITAGRASCCIISLLKIFPQAQLSPAASVSIKPSSATSWPFRLASISTSTPNTASVMPASCFPCKRSPNTKAPRMMVKNACACSTSEARPAGIPNLMAQKRNANWPKLMVRP